MSGNVLDVLASNGAIQPPSEVAAENERRTAFGRTLHDVAPLVPEEQDKSILFRHNFLAKGQAITLTASSGVGKSSMAMQFAFHWALGKSFMAEPMRPLKCAIIQSEDSERDVAEQLDGMRLGLCGGFKADGVYEEGLGWSEEEFEKAKREILCPTCFVGKVGNGFIKMLGEFQRETKCDMIFVNPIQAFFGGDVSDQKDVSEWTRAGIDPIIKNEECPCGIFLVAHTAKFKSGDEKGRANVKDYGEYIIAGSHEWTDWTRAAFVFLKKSKSDTYFEFAAAKRGTRLGWKDANGKRTTSKIFKHSDGFIFWKEVTDPEEIAAACPVEKTVPAITHEEAVTIAERMVEWIRNNRAVTRHELSEKSDAFKELGLKNRIEIRAGGNIIKKHYKDYHMQYTRDGYGFSEGLRVLDNQREQAREIERMAREERKRRLASGNMNDLPDAPEVRPW